MPYHAKSLVQRPALPHFEHQKYMNALHGSDRMIRDVLYRTGLALLKSDTPPTRTLYLIELNKVIRQCRAIYRDERAVDEALRGCGLPEYQVSSK